MPRIFDNIDQSLLPALQQTLADSQRADFCVGYFNLRGWQAVGEHIEHFAGEDGAQCRLLVGMHRSESDDLRRTRSFVKQHYASTDCSMCGSEVLPSEPACPMCRQPRLEEDRRYLRFSDGSKSFFPLRIPRTVTFTTSKPDDPYARLYADEVVAAIGGLHLPRYGLGGYVRPNPKEAPTPAERRELDNLSRAGRRLMGFCRTNLFKRLESSGEAFIRSIERHALRNLIFVHAIEHGLDLPIGPQDAEMLDTDIFDEDRDLDPSLVDDDALSEQAEGDPIDVDTAEGVRSETMMRAAAAHIYALYRTQYARRFRWLRPSLFRPALKKHLLEDADAIIAVLNQIGRWRPEEDIKLTRLEQLLEEHHPREKVLVFSQFADTIRYLERGLRARGITSVAAVTGTTDDPTALAHRFSPCSNEKDIPPGRELRILLATDVLSEGQNLQDAHVVVNFDLPWALIRLVQRAGRVDRIGQAADEILCYSFLPAEGVEKIIRLRERVRQRLQENAEVVGSDEQFFEDSDVLTDLQDLYNEKAGLLDDDESGDVDLPSLAFGIWQSAIRQDPRLKRLIEELPEVVYSTKPHSPTDVGPEGVLVYVRTAQGADAMAWLNRAGQSVTESPLAILKAAECEPDTPALERHADHHHLVHEGVGLVQREGRRIGGQLGRKTGARYRTYERLKDFLHGNPLFATDALKRAFQALHEHPLAETAKDTLNRQLRANISDEGLAELVVSLHDEERLVVAHEDNADGEPQIICSLGLKHA